MIIEKRKVKIGEELHPETKMRIATLLGLSAALVLSACASTQPKVEEKTPEISAKKIAEPRNSTTDSTMVIAPKTETDSSVVQDSVTAPLDFDPGPLGGIVEMHYEEDI